MGLLNQNIVSSAGKYLVSHLETKPIIDTDAFFDGSEELDERLIEEMKQFGLEDYRESNPGLYIDVAAIQLEKAGFIEMKDVGLLTACDCSPRYEISLSPSGKRMFSTVKNFQFHSVDL